ncbi:MAG: hypothetical protein QOJ98_3123 [Acidobacteriota bacterium]|jgi:hypothetical protein|nr:hypothetical protein [Acidobacteriota bacterium]
MRTRLSILILSVILSGSMSLHAAPSGVRASFGPLTGWDFRVLHAVQRILRLVPKEMGDRLSPPKPDAAPAPFTIPRCASADCLT